MNKKIEIKCKGNRYLPYNMLKSFQGNLKEMSKESAAKLRQSILNHGWIAPIFVWNKNPLDFSKSCVILILWHKKNLKKR